MDILITLLFLAVFILVMVCDLQNSRIRRLEDMLEEEEYRTGMLMKEIGRLTK